MTTISVTPILGSRNIATGGKVAAMLMRYPRWIHAEGRTHRLLSISEEETRTPSLMEDRNLSRNAASSRAIPVAKIIQSILDDPAVPLYWGKNQRGMQADEEFSATEAYELERQWLQDMYDAIGKAEWYDKKGVHKQIVNRILEPYSHITVVVSATNWSNFLTLRDHTAAEPHIQLLARRTREVLETMIYNDLQPGEWHLPFVTHPERMEYRHEACLKLSVARCASTSYKTVEGFDMTLETAARIHDGLLSAQPIHASPAEHQCYADHRYLGGELQGKYQRPELHGNFTGFCQYRKTLPGECQ